MNECIRVNIPNSKSYNIYFEKDFKRIKALTKQRRLFLFSDSNVIELYGEKLYEAIGKKITTFVFKAGEKSKNINTIIEAYTMLMENNYDRDTLILALGGGVCGDLAGFTAATYMRGVDYAQIPTSLLAQVDSSVGGKTGFDFKNAKNIIGAFYQPTFVYTNINTLKTLSDKDFSSGMGEVIKHGLIRDEEYFNFISNKKETIKRKEYVTLLKMVQKSCLIKRDVVIEDEKESSLRAILNFGHTIGHGIEAASDYKLSHGEAIAIGIICTLHLSATKKGIIDKIKNVFKYFELPIDISGIKVEDITKYIKNDKKYKNGKIRFIKMKEIGHAFIDANVKLEHIEEELKKILH